MIIPQFWAEAKKPCQIDGRSMTFKRFGWSDLSQEDAQKNAQLRVDAAAGQAQAGEKVRKVDHKVSYNGAEGLPIREEIISRHNDVILTRNSYGAVCLNTPDVLFADVDFQFEPSLKFSMLVFVILIILSVFIGILFSSKILSGILIFFALFFSLSVSTLVHKLRSKNRGGPREIALEKIQHFSQAHPDWNLRLYRTPMGYRVLVMHDTFEANCNEVQEFFAAIDADSMYQAMCKNQNCFRARLSPKPWRMGFERLRPTPGVWPINPDRMAERKLWIEKYEAEAVEYAACHFEIQLGSNRIDAKADFVRALHDRLCKSDQELKLA